MSMVQVLTGIMALLQDYYPPRSWPSGVEQKGTWVRGGTVGEAGGAAAGEGNWYIGPQYLATKGAPQRVVWCPPQDETYGPPMRVGHEHADAGVGIKAIANRQIPFEVHLWGNDYDDCEDLLNYVCAAVYDLTCGSGDKAPMLSRGGWKPRQEGDRGVLYVLPIVVGVPVYLPKVGHGPAHRVSISSRNT